MLTGRVVRLGEDKGTGPAAILKRLGRPLGRALHPPGAAPGHAHPRRQLRAGADHRGGADAGRAATRRRATASPSTCWASGPRRPPTPSAISTATWRRSRRSAKRAGPPPADERMSLMARPSISVKLSAIHPRFDPGKEARLDAELLPRLVELAAAARRHGLGLTIDAEEQDRLDLTLGLFAAAFRDPALEGWPGLGLAVQAYGKRALPVLRWLRSAGRARGQADPRAARQGRLLGQRDQVGAGAWACRLSGVHAQGAHGCVVSRLHAVHAADTGGAFFPQFATHNAHIDRRRRTWRRAKRPSSSSACTAWARRSMRRWSARAGCGACPAASTRRSARTRTSWRTWCGGCSRTAPTPPSSTGWPTRRRRSRRSSAIPSRRVELERQRNGAAAAAAAGHLLPERAQQRRAGAQRAVGARAAACARSRPSSTRPFAAVPDRRRQDAGSGERGRAGAEPARSAPARRHRALRPMPAAIEAALAARARPRRTPGTALGGPARAAILDRAADLYERDRVRLMAVMVREAGKTLDNALGDVREAVDFLRYYASEARRLFAGAGRARRARPARPTRWRCGGAARSPASRPGTSRWRSSRARWRRRWRPATPCWRSPPSRRRSWPGWPCELLHEAGVPPDVLHLLPGAGAVGAALVKDPRVAGVAFTGSNDDGLGHQPGAGGAARRDRALHRRDRRHERHDRRLQRAARAGDPRRGALGLRLGGAALLGGAPVLRAGGRGEAA